MNDLSAVVHTLAIMSSEYRALGSANLRGADLTDAAMPDGWKPPTEEATQ
jgi:hypothetical protein